jgi:PAS domain S-box-containing protein
MPHPTEVPSEVVEKWQEIVDLLAEIIQVPSALVMRVGPPNIRVFVSSHSEGNPYEQDEVASLDTGLYCETVMKTRQPLLVPDALEDDEWKSNPDIKLGMISYLGFPIIWPDGEVFGTICVLDTKKNEYSALYRKLLLQCREIVQADLRTLAALHEELTTHKVHLGELFARVPEAMVLLDVGGRVVRVNPEFTKIFGYPEGEALRRPLGDLVVPEELRDEAPESAGRMTYGEESLIVETVRRRRDGTRVPVSIVRVPVMSQGSQIAEYAIYRDMTETKRAEEALRLAQAELAHVTRVTTLGELVASIAHEINQPLAGIVADAHASLNWLAAADPNLERVREALNGIVADGNRAADLIQGIRQLATKRAPQKARLDINDVIRDVVPLVRAELLTHQVSLHIELAPQLAPLLADRVQLQQVILNLVMNSIEAMASVGDRRRELIVRSAPHDRDQVMVTVQDTGVGIDPNTVDKLFSAFFTTRPGGMGMGLSISRSIIEAHGGRLWATPNEPRGAIFHFSLPVDGKGEDRLDRCRPAEDPGRQSKGH